MVAFYQELHEEEIHLRDRYQFELKSDYFPDVNADFNHYKMEFYFFIPKSLQIHAQNYSKEQFFTDQTHFMRFKTPQISFAQLIDPNYRASPLAQIRRLIGEASIEEERISDELKLLGNIVRSSLRNQVRQIADKIWLKEGKKSRIEKETLKLTDDLSRLRDAYLVVEEGIIKLQLPFLKRHASYVDEFLSLTVEYYLTRLLTELTESKELSPESLAFEALRKLIRREYLHRKTNGYPSTLVGRESIKSQEEFLYRKGLLKKFVMSALLLSMGRSQPAKTISPYLGALAAGLAMLFYFTFFVLQGQVFVINSLPFILVTVFLYVLKDRLKDTVKTLFENRASSRYPDYRTTLHTPLRQTSVGVVEETFRFVEEKDLEEQIAAIRNQCSIEEIEKLSRQETLFCFKKEVFLNAHLLKKGARRCELNHIFRFNIERFLQKAGDPFHFHYYYDFESEQMKQINIPKVYHINIVIRHTFKNKSGEPTQELKRVRLVIDKEGIKRIEKVL